MLVSINNWIVVEKYKDHLHLKTAVVKGLCLPTQKYNVVGLKVLVSTQVVFGNKVMEIPAGAIAYFLEDAMSTGSFRPLTELEGKPVDASIIPTHEIVMVDQWHEAL